MTDTRISFRPGPLAEPLIEAAKAAGVERSEYIRRVLAKHLKRPIPELKVGKPREEKK